MNKRILFGLISVTLLITAVAFASPYIKLSAASQWTIYNIYMKPTDFNGFHTDKPRAIPGNAIEFDFLNTPNRKYSMSTSYLLTHYNGDLTGKKITAMFKVIASDDAVFTYRIRPDGSCSGDTLPSLRLEFQTTTSGTYIETDYWWSNPDSYILANSGDFVTMEVPLTGDRWSDINGHFGNDPLYAEAFANALKKVKQIGFSFGGGSCFANGVGLSSGSATFQLVDYSLSNI